MGCGVIQDEDVDPSDAWRDGQDRKEDQTLPTNLTDDEWARIEPFLPGLAKSGGPVETDLREVLNAIRYLARSDGGWRMRPEDFPRLLVVSSVCPALHVPDDLRCGVDARP
jgi:hypothetical protein